MGERFPRLTAREVRRVLARNGFLLVSQKGSHEKWRNEATGRQVIVAEHKGQTLPLGTLKSIVDGSGLPPAEFRA